jgi:hypothetical protein
MNKTELAKAFDVSTTTVDNWLRRGMPFVSKGRSGRSWEFDEYEVRDWKSRQDNNSFPFDPPEGMTGNALRDFSQLAIEHFFFSLMGDFLSPVSGMLKREGLPDDENKKICLYLYFLAEYFAMDYLKKDLFNKFLTASCGTDLDEFWNLVCLRPLQRNRTFPIVKQLQRPGNIQMLLSDEDLYNAAKEFCTGKTVKKMEAKRNDRINSS